MQSWRSRIAAGFAIGAAVVTIPLTAGTASADDPVPPLRPVAGGYDSYGECMADGAAWVPKFDDFQCAKQPSGKYMLFAR
ncbi:hypothetical protein [Streptomyces violaceusniger]|uniref:Secreted protein n=1 Tax=Streptomyces violaceusniger TaxID=68280 RepID=A0A4D4KKZ3_STRVO|nr:hypothetical protein SVIO_004340 [Streptomyces violaceusniger]